MDLSLSLFLKFRSSFGVFMSLFIGGILSSFYNSYRQLVMRFCANPRTTFLLPLGYFGESIVVVVAGRMFYLLAIAADWRDFDNIFWSLLTGDLVKEGWDYFEIYSFR